jgi:hypothetical protein
MIAAGDKVFTEGPGYAVVEVTIERISREYAILTNGHCAEVERCFPDRAACATAIYARHLPEIQARARRAAADLAELSAATGMDDNIYPLVHRLLDALEVRRVIEQWPALGPITATLRDRVPKC